MNRRWFNAAMLFAAGQAWNSVRRKVTACQATAIRKSRRRTERGSTGRPNAVLPTLGGRQFWADELFFHEWHIQRNVLTGHYRLLDSANLRHAWGTLAECRNKLEEIKLKRRLAADDWQRRGRAARAVSQRRRHERHGAISCASKATTASSTLIIQRRKARSATTRAALDLVMRSLTGIEEVHFVAHSLGNLVIRHYLADQQRAGTPDARRRADRHARSAQSGPRWPKHSLAIACFVSPLESRRIN